MKITQQYQSNIEDYKGISELNFNYHTDLISQHFVVAEKNSYFAEKPFINLHIKI